MSAHRLSWESLDLHLLPKNFSYEDNYHRKFYYPKLVYERIRQRQQTVKPSNGSAGSLSGISSSSSVPDLLETFQAESGEVGLGDFSEFDERTENVGDLSQRDRRRRRVPFSLGESVDEEATGHMIEQDDNSSTSTDSVITTSIASVSSAVCLLISTRKAFFSAVTY